MSDHSEKTQEVLKSHPADPAQTPSGLDRRGFLKISSAVAATAAVAGAGLAQEGVKKKSKNPGTPRPKGAAQDFKGGWFIV